MQLEGLLAIVELEGSFVFRFKEGSRREGLHGIVKLELCQQGKAILATTLFCFLRIEFN